MTNDLKLIAGSASAVILPKRGALVSSLWIGGAERLWMPAEFAPNDTGWPGGGVPLLFPFAGRVFHQGQPFLYDLGGEVRTMPIHGFAYGMPWAVESATTDSARLTAEDTDATRKLFPFSFQMQLAVKLTETELTMTFSVTHQVRAGAPATMPIACGFHPYFKLPGSLANTRIKTYATTQVQVTPAGGAGKPAPLAHPIAATRGIPLTSPITANVILTDHARPEAVLYDETTGSGVKIAWRDARSPLKYLVLWRKDGDGFQCVEPWMGLPDAVQNGAGLARLAVDESLVATISLAPA